jgi:acetyl esterase/lipase
MAPCRTHVYRRVDVGELLADVYSPAPAEDSSTVVLWLHGGALIFGSRKDIPDTYVSRLLAKGCTVVSVDYRLAPEAKLPDIFDDIEHAYAWIQEQLPALHRVDPRSIVVMGQSAGGYLSLLAGLRLEPRPSAVVALYGYGNIGDAWYTRPSRHYRGLPLVTREEALASVGGTFLGAPEGRDRFTFYLYCRQTARWPIEVAGVDPDENEEGLKAWSPIHHVDGSWPPSLLLHGIQDTDVPFEQSRQMAEALGRWSPKHRFVAISGEGHGFDLQPGGPGVEHAWASISEFLDRNVKAEQ